MAIDTAYLHYLAPVLTELGKKRPLRIACLSYPDLLLTPQDVVRAFPSVSAEALQTRADSEAICAWHGIKKPIQITDTQSLFTALGHTADFYDLKQFRGCEIILNLNEPLPTQYEGKYDLVIDTGTLEHCFNVGVAFTGMCKLADVGGVVLTQAPLSKVNHGFWNFSPCVYDNFFQQNKWAIKYIQVYKIEAGMINKFNPSGNGRFAAPPESIIIACAQRVVGSSNNFPTQAKYLVGA
jgi:hypothetical protein